MKTRICGQPQEGQCYQAQEKKMETSIFMHKLEPKLYDTIFQTLHGEMRSSNK